MESCSQIQICKSLDENSTLNWNNPRYSGAVLGLVNLFFLTMVVSKLNVFVLFAYFFLFYVVSSVVVAQFMTKTDKDDNEYEHVSKETIENALKVVYDTLYAFDVYIKKVACLADIALTLKFFVAVYAFMTVSGWFTDCFLIWVAINVLFAWKPVTRTQKDKIDSIKGQISGALTKAFTTVDALIPKYKEPTKRD